MNEASTVDVADIDRQLAAIEAQEKRVTAKLQRLRKSIEEAERERNKLDAQRHRLKLRRLIGRPVKKKPIWGTRTPHETDELIGTLLKVNRKYAVVDYGDAGKWNIPIDWLQAAEAEGFDEGALVFV